MQQQPPSRHLVTGAQLRPRLPAVGFGIKDPGFALFALFALNPLNQKGKPGIHLRCFPLQLALHDSQGSTVCVAATPVCVAFA